MKMGFKRALYKIGIDIKFVKKNEDIDPIAYNLREHFDDIWQDTKKIEINTNKEYQQFYHKLVDLIKDYNINLNNKKVVDLGCGMGIMLSILNEKYENLQIYGFDVSQNAVNLAKKRIPTGKFDVFDIYKPSEEKYDIIFCMEVLEHLLDPETALKNIIARMHTESTVIITVPDGRKDQWMGHINFWSPESWNVFIQKMTGDMPYVTGRLTDKVIYAIIGANIKK